MSQVDKGKLVGTGSGPRPYKSPKRHPEDVIVWGDGTWCYFDELWEMDFMSEDYAILVVDSPEWFKHLGEIETDFKEQKELLDDVYKRKTD